MPCGRSVRLASRLIAAVAALLILLSVVAVPIRVARIATRAFMLTGLSKETARFQARSIITGTGFTTDEAEHIVNHPVRRRISLTLMLIGNAGLPHRRLYLPDSARSLKGHGLGSVSSASPRHDLVFHRIRSPCIF